MVERALMIQFGHGTTKEFALEQRCEFTELILGNGPRTAGILNLIRLQIPLHG